MCTICRDCSRVFVILGLNAIASNVGNAVFETCPRPFSPAPDAALPRPSIVPSPVVAAMFTSSIRVGVVPVCLPAGVSANLSEPIVMMCGVIASLEAVIVFVIPCARRFCKQLSFLANSKSLFYFCAVASFTCILNSTISLPVVSGTTTASGTSGTSGDPGRYSSSSPSSSASSSSAGSIALCLPLLPSLCPLLAVVD